MGLEALKATLDKATASDLLEVEAYVSRLAHIKAADVALGRRSGDTLGNLDTVGAGSNENGDDTDVSRKNLAAFVSALNDAVSGF